MRVRNVNPLFEGETVDKYLFNLVGGVVLKQDGLVLLLGGQHTPIHRLILSINSPFVRNSISSVFHIIVLSKNIDYHLYSHRRSP